MVLVKADKHSEKGVLPDGKLLADMGKFNDELAEAGAMLAAEGLQPSSKGARVRFSGPRPAASPVRSRVIASRSTGAHRA